MRAVAVLLVVALVAVAGCASSAPPRPAARPFDHVNRLAVVVSGESTFTVLADSAEPGRTFDEILKWGFWGSAASLLRPVAELVHRGINWLLEADRTSDAKVDLLLVRATILGQVFLEQPSIEGSNLKSVGALFSSEVQLVEEMTFWDAHAEDEPAEQPYPVPVEG